MAQTRRSGTGARSQENLLQAVLLCIVLAVVITLVLSWWAGTFLAGGDPSGNPIQGVFESFTGQRPWPWQSTVIAVALVVSVAAVALPIAIRRAKGRTEVDRAARTMVAPNKLRGVSPKESHRLMPQFDKSDPRSWGFLLGTTVVGDKPVYLSWEMVMVALAGTRMGKTVALAVRATLAAPGPAIVTSNKPDLHAATRLGREQVGHAWVSDLQGVSGSVQLTFWWNALKHVRTLAQARKLASFFVSASTKKDAKTDGYFDGGAQELLALYCLAAALAGGDLLHAVSWLGSDQNKTPAQILDAFDKKRAAARVLEAQGLTERQRDGLFDMARRFLDILSDDEYARAVTPPARAIIEVDARDRTIAPLVTTRYGEPLHDLPEFDPRAFVASTDTLYALSLEGPDSAAPLTTALVGQIFDEAAALASRTPARSYDKKMPRWWPIRLWQPTVRTQGGRLDVPLLAILDEAANTVLLRQLPDQYSHFGGRGIIPIAILQSPQQGARVWGRDEFDSMIAGAVHFYGGNIKDKQYLSDLSEQIGSHEVQSTTRSSGQGSRSSSHSWQERPILPINELAALPKSRAIVVFPENPPVLIKKIWWTDTDDADTIKQSIMRYSGSAEQAKELLDGPFNIDYEPEHVDEYELEDWDRSAVSVDGR
ncbi:type IV secretory system conjugative DNA transfer family protein [Rhodococcus sp. KRD197]|uniref:type IV secretory system conjugative DNA transfer family protein n=1 Tax=Rhodococcus sp. KRD197 TaxID=2729731 RepID=UPI0019D1CA51|nr:type IV secretory system conjugative DNA transfer family protein [Rhodococcus sp. KRD197]